PPCPDRAPDHRTDPAGPGPSHEVAGVGFERVGARSTTTAVAARGQRYGITLRAVRDHAEQQQALDPLSAKEVCRVTVLLLHQEHEEAAAVDLSRTRHLRVPH